MLIATAGHVDHGKSTLVNALTGADTDRLPEEKRRGLTIEPGFSFLPYPSSSDSQAICATLGFVDLPGHEKFIRNMAAGVGAIDVALLVVAADDGVMPQTREHVAILDLMGVSNGVVAVTRVDLVDENSVADVQKEVVQLLEGTSLEGALSIPVCAPLKKGIAELTDILFDLAARSTTMPADAYFRLAIDRAFSVHGAGTVVTGSVFSGSVSEGDTVNLLPHQQTARVRGLRVNGAHAVTASRGQRAALNLANIDKTDVEKGDWITATAQTVLSTCVDVQVRVLDTEPRALRHWTPVHIHAGAATTTGRVALYADRAVEPGGSAWAQLVLLQPMHLLFQDRFVLRDQSASRTIGGGRVVDPFASRQKNFRKNRLPVIEALSSPDHHVALTNALDVSPAGLSVNTFRHGRNLTIDDFSGLLKDCAAVSSTDEKGEERLFTQARIESALYTLLTSVEQFHISNPEDAGIESSALMRDCKLSPALLAEASKQLLQQGRLLRTGVRLKLPEHTPKLNDDDADLLNRLYELAKPASMQPPSLSELIKQLEIERALLVEKLTQFGQLGLIVGVAKNRFYHPAALEQLAEIARELTRENTPAGFDARSFRDRAGIGRNTTIDVLEYFDKIGLTRRIKDHRVTRR